MSKPMSWKWRLGIALVILVLFLIGYIFTDAGHLWLKGKMVEYYEELPESERRDSPWADRYLTLAWWRGSICGDEKEATIMYRDFMGLSKDPKGRTVFETGKLIGLCSQDGKYGWGPLHPKAPDAFWSFIEMYDSANSAQYTSQECYKYNLLFYTWMIRYSPDHKPHPKFNKHWPMIKNLIAKISSAPPPGVDMSAPLAAPWVDEE